VSGAGEDMKGVTPIARVLMGNAKQLIIFACRIVICKFSVGNLS